MLVLYPFRCPNHGRQSDESMIQKIVKGYVHDKKPVNDRAINSIGSSLDKMNA